MRARALLPRQQLRRVAARRVTQTRHDHHVKLKPFGFVQGHQLQLRTAHHAGLRVGRRKQFGDLFFQRGEINDFAAFLQRFKQSKNRLSVFKIGAFLHAGWATQRKPCAFDPARGRYATPRRDKFTEYAAHPCQSARAIGRQFLHARFIVHQRPNGCGMIVASERV